MTRPQVFIEKIMPVKLLNQQVYYEHGGNPFKGLHRWYSRKPLSFSRASVLASILPYELTIEQFLYIMGIYGQEEVDFWEQSKLSEEEKDTLRNIKEIRLYKQPPTSPQIKKMEELCQQIWGTTNPSILDAFAGGGSIPFEALRYGLNVFASDLNPVAVITMKAAMEYPLKFGKSLQKDIDKWVNFVGNEAQKRLAEFFPSSPLSKSIDPPLTPPSKGGELDVEKAPSKNGELDVEKAPLSQKENSKAPLSKGGWGDQETIQNYLWAHTVTCPHCQSVIPLSPNWWLSKTSNYAGKGQARKVTANWYAVKPIPNLLEKRVDFELIKGRKGKGTTIETETGDFDPDVYATVKRSVGKCCNCDNIIEQDYLMKTGINNQLGYQLYAVAFKQGKGSLEFRLPNEFDLEGFSKAEKYLQENYIDQFSELLPNEIINTGFNTDQLLRYGMDQWSKLFNTRQLLTLVTYVEIINDAKQKILTEYELEKAQAIISYLALVLDICADKNCRLSIWQSSAGTTRKASTQHSLNLMWNYPEMSGSGVLWLTSAEIFAFDYYKLCEYFNKKTLEKNQKEVEEINLFNYTNPPLTSHSKGGELETEKPPLKTGELVIEKSPLKKDELATEKPPLPRGGGGIKINLESADSLYHLPDKSLEAIVTDPPYYGTIQYGELSDFFYVWNKRVLGDLFPDIFWQELTDKEREAVANPSRFRNMGESPDELAKRDYEAKMSMAWQEAYRVLKDEGVLTVQFNHKEAGAWDTLAKALIDAGFEITASWAVSTENPQNLHQAKKNSVSSTVILVCRKRGVALTPNPSPHSPLPTSHSPLPTSTAWWDDLKPEVANLVEARASYFEDNEITGIDLYLSAFGVALSVFSKYYPILDSSGEEVRPEVAFAEARKAIAAYRFRKLVQTETDGFDPLTQWYLLGWDAFGAREFPFDEARQLALAIGGFSVDKLVKEYKIIDAKSGNCTILTPQQRFKKRVITTDIKSFSANNLIDALHSIIVIYEEEKTLEKVRQFMQKTGLVANSLFMKTIEVAFKVIPDNVKEKEVLINLWLGLDEIKEKVSYYQGKLL